MAGYFSIGPDEYLYVIVNQLHRQARFHYGKDLRQKPYSLLRINKIDEFPAPAFENKNGRFNFLEHNWFHLAFILKEIKFQKKMKEII